MCTCVYSCGLIITKWNVMPFIRRGSSFSFFAALNCSCLGFNDLLALLTKEGGNKGIKSKKGAMMCSNDSKWSPLLACARTHNNRFETSNEQVKTCRNYKLNIYTGWSHKKCLLPPLMTSHLLCISTSFRVLAAPVSWSKHFFQPFFDLLCSFRSYQVALFALNSGPLCKYIAGSTSEIIVDFSREITEKVLKWTKKVEKRLKKCFDQLSVAASTRKLVEIHNTHWWENKQNKIVTPLLGSFSD